MNKDPHQRLEILERVSAWGTLIILAGIGVEIWLFFGLPVDDPHERIFTLVANCLIAIGLIMEYAAIRLTIVAASAAKQESDEKIAEANARALDAQLRLENLRKQTGPRVFDSDIFLSTLAGYGKATVVEILCSPAAGDGIYVVSQLRRLLGAADWPSFCSFESLPVDHPLFKQPASFDSETGTSTGIVLWQHPPDMSVITSSAWGLSHSISLSLGGIGGSANADPSLKAGEIRVVVLPR